MSNPGYTVVTETDANGQLQFTARGPGLGEHKPLFKYEHDANTLCKVLEEAFRAGERSRSQELLELLSDGNRLLGSR